MGNRTSYGREKGDPRRKHEISSLDMMQVKMDSLALKVQNMSQNPNIVAAVASECELCETQGNQPAECNLLNEPCSDQVNYTQGNPFSNTYNPGWRNHPNFSYKNNSPIQNSAPPRPTGFQAQRPNQPMQAVAPKPNLEKIMENFISAQTQQNKEFLNHNIQIRN